MSTTAVSPVELATVASASSSQPSAQESPMRTTVTALRTFVLAFLILAGSLGAALAAPARDAAAAGPCAVASSVKYGVSNGRYYVFGRGAASCSYDVNQTVTVDLYANGSMVTTGLASVYGRNLAANTYNSVWGYCGVRYQVLTIHRVNGYSNTWTWSNPFYLC